MIVMMCQVPVSIDYHMHLNSAKPVWIVSVMIRTESMTLILKKKKKMPKLQTPVEARRRRSKKRRKKKVKTAKRRSKMGIRYKVMVSVMRLKSRLHVRRRNSSRVRNILPCSCVICKKR